MSVEGVTALDRRRALATLATWVAGAAGTVALPGCGGSGSSSSSGSTRLRALNLTSDLPSIDLLTDDTNRYAALASDAMSDYLTFDAATVALKVRRAGDATQLYSSSFVLAKDEVYTAVVWGRETSLRVHTLPEDAVDTDIADGAARLRVFNATIDAGSLDVYVTSATADIAESAALQSALAGGTLGSYRDLSAGTFRLRVTGAGDPTDLRLDVPAIVLANRKHATLVITAGASGVLVNGVLIPLQGTATVMKNTQARVRVVASVGGAGNVAVTVGGQVVAGGYRSPTVGPYTRVAAGTVDVAVRLDGGSPSTTSLTLVPGADYTLLVTGSAGAARLRPLTDDNRVPVTASRAKVRLVHGVTGLDPLTLSVDYLPVATDLAEGTASTPATLASSSAARVDVTAASAAQPVYSVDSVNLQTGSVYTVFVLGGNTAPTGVIRKER